MPNLTPDAKAKLARTIRDLRGTKEDPNGGSLLKGLREAAQSTYRLSIPNIREAGLAEEAQEKRSRLEKWLDEQWRADKAGKTFKDPKKVERESKARHFTEAIKLAGATVLNRLVVVMQLEAQGVVSPAVVTGGRQSPGYREFQEFSPALCRDERDKTEGFGLLLKLLYDELALELPGVFGSVGVTELSEVPASTLWQVVEGLNAPELVSAWTDDTTLGWVYQYWNDPEREALDTKLNGGGKVASHEIASKTQMFTERYMVEWLLQNSLGQQWLAICGRNGWVPEVVADGTLERLEARRQDWREKREAGEVALDALMPIENEAEARWKYWVQQPELGSEGVPESIRALKIFDPACGSGHFLVIAFDLLLAFYAEEARHWGESWSEQHIVESILENNLFGLDLDARAVQIAAAALYLKGKAVCAGARPKALNLVASNLNLAALPVDDPARGDLRGAVQAETGIPGALTDEIVEALKGADAWGSLLQVDQAVDAAIREYEKGVQASLLENKSNAPLPSLGEGAGVRAILLEKLEGFLTRYTHSDDLGLRLKGEQLAAGVRFIRMVREGAYDLVIGNPPYQGTSKIEDSSYVAKHYKNAKADLYAAFLERGLQLVKSGGLSALLTMRNWMFISQYSKIREYLIGKHDLRLIGDLETGAFEEVSAAQVVLSVAMAIFRRTEPSQTESIALQPAPGDLKSEGNTNRKRAALLTQIGRFEFKTNRFDVIKEKPLIYWWDEAFLKRYAETPKMEDETEVKQGMATADNTRFLRFPWEVQKNTVLVHKCSFQTERIDHSQISWVPYIKGAAGKKWFEPLSDVLLWNFNMLQIYLMERDGKKIATAGKNDDYYFVPGICYSTIGASFSARSRVYQSVFDVSGSSVFPNDVASVLVRCLYKCYFSRAKSLAVET